MSEINQYSVILTVLKNKPGTGSVDFGAINVLGGNGGDAAQIITHLAQTVCHPLKI